MKHQSAVRQQGASFLGLLVLVAAVALIGVLAAQVIPSVMERSAIQSAVDRAKDGSTPDEVRKQFDRTAEIEGIDSISGKDLEITKDASGKMVVTYAYDRQFRLVGPAYLLIKYAGRSI